MRCWSYYVKVHLHKLFTFSILDFNMSLIYKQKHLRIYIHIMPHFCTQHTNNKSEIINCHIIIFRIIKIDATEYNSCLEIYVFVNVVNQGIHNLYRSTRMFSICFSLVRKSNKVFLHFMSLTRYSCLIITHSREQKQQRYTYHRHHHLHTFSRKRTIQT